MKLRLEGIIYSPRNMVWDQYTAPGNRARWDPALLRARVRARLARDMANFSEFLDGRDREPARGVVSLDPPS